MPCIRIILNSFSQVQTVFKLFYSRFFKFYDMYRKRQFLFHYPHSLCFFNYLQALPATFLENKLHATAGTKQANY